MGKRKWHEIGLFRFDLFKACAGVEKQNLNNNRQVPLSTSTSNDFTKIHFNFRNTCRKINRRNEFIIIMICVKSTDSTRSPPSNKLRVKLFDTNLTFPSVLMSLSLLFVLHWRCNCHVFFGNAFGRSFSNQHPIQISGGMYYKLQWGQLNPDFYFYQVDSNYIGLLIAPRLDGTIL